MAEAVRKKPKRRRQKKVAGRNVGPARERYWRERRLEAKKVRALIRCCGMSEADARALWRMERQGRPHGNVAYREIPRTAGAD